MASRAMKNWALYSLLGVFTLAGVTFATMAYLNYDPNLTESIASAKTTASAKLSQAERFDPHRRYTSEDDWQTIYPDTKPMKIGEATVQASVAKTWPERIAGLSNTPYLPEEVVKLFVFDTAGFHSIWMKDMNYAIDIIWLDEAGVVVHLVENATPESFPDSFIPEAPAIYVVETITGFIKKHNVVIGQATVLPTLN